MPAKENAVASVAHSCAADGKQRLGKWQNGTLEGAKRKMLWLKEVAAKR